MASPPVRSRHSLGRARVPTDTHARRVDDRQKALALATVMPPRVRHTAERFALIGTERADQARWLATDGTGPYRRLVARKETRGRSPEDAASRSVDLEHQVRRRPEVVLVAEPLPARQDTRDLGVHAALVSVETKLMIDDDGVPEPADLESAQVPATFEPDPAQQIVQPAKRRVALDLQVDPEDRGALGLDPQLEE